MMLVDSGGIPQFGRRTKPKSTSARTSITVPMDAPHPEVDIISLSLMAMSITSAARRR